MIDVVGVVLVVDVAVVMVGVVLVVVVAVGVVIECLERHMWRQRMKSI